MPEKWDHPRCELIIASNETDKVGCKVTLTHKRKGSLREWVTHRYDPKRDVLTYGVYFADFRPAMENYLERCREVDIDPTPEVGQ